MGSKQVENACASCGQAFFAYRYDIEERGRKYCSNACAQAPRRISRPDKAELETRYRAGSSTNDLAAEYGVSKGTIYNWFRHHEISTRSIGQGISLATTGKPASEHRKAAIGAAHRALHAHKTWDRLCEYCGKEFRLNRPSSDQRFCTQHCAAMHNTKERMSSGRGRIRGSRSGKRDTLGGLFVRSSWEHNVALWLMWRTERGEITGWEYEPECFDYPFKKGNNHYTPDFKILHHDGSHEWIEVKGWMDQDSKVKLKRFAKYFPHERLTVMDGVAYRALAKEFKDVLPHWETTVSPSQAKRASK